LCEERGARIQEFRGSGFRGSRVIRRKTLNQKNIGTLPIFIDPVRSDTSNGVDNGEGCVK
jgi:hypothetical protein